MLETARASSRRFEQLEMFPELAQNNCSSREQAEPKRPKSVREALWCERIAFDNVMLTAYDRCPRFFWFRHVAGWTKPEAALPLEFGKAWHAALDYIYTCRMEGREPILERAQEVLAQAYDEAVPPAYQLPPRTTEHGHKMLRAYLEHYPTEPFRVLKVEVGFCVPLPLGDAQLIGRIDGIIEHESYGLCILEHKTTSVMGTTYLRTFRPNNQVTGYIYAAQFYEPKLRRAIVNIAQVAKTRMEFARVPTSRTDAELEDFARQIAWKVERIWEDDCWVMNTTSCSYYGKCMYHDLCFAGYTIEHWAERLVSGEPPDGYVEDVWHPYE